MPIETADALFLEMLSQTHARERHMAQMWENLSQRVQDPEVKNILSARAYLTQVDATNIEKCFQLLGKQPSKPNTQVYEMVSEEIRKTFDTIQPPGLKAIYALRMIRTAQNALIGEYTALTLMAEAAGNVAVANLLEHNLADKIDFIEHTRERFKQRIHEAVSARLTGARG